MMGCGGNCLKRCTTGVRPVHQDGQDGRMDRMRVWQVWWDELLAQLGEVLKG